MQSLDSNSTLEPIGDASQEYPVQLAKHRSRLLFETLMQRLGSGTGHADFVRFLDARASYDQIRDWRRGRARIPNWAWESLEAMLTARAQADLDYARMARKADRQSRASNIGAWNARRAKEKAAPKDGP